MVYHILLKPDLFLKNKIREAINMITESGILIYYAMLIRPNTDLFNLMYLDGFNWKHDYCQHNALLYSLGPCLSLVCDIPLNISLNIKNFKGESLPILKANPNSFRSKFNVCDRCINSIHIADSYDKSCKELKELYHINNINNLLRNLNHLKVYEIVTQLTEYVLDYYAQKVNKITGNIVLDNLFYRIQHYLDFLDSLHVRWNNFKKLSELKDISLNYRQVWLHSTEVEKERFLEYLLYLMDENMVYYSKFEKYFLKSDILYYSINIHK